jgi:hypothetical protein
MKISFKLFYSISFITIFAGCNMNTNIEGIGSDSPAINDFAKTEIITGDAVPADGNSQLLVAIHLKNSDNRPVKEFQPTYDIENNASGVIKNQCSTSDINGVSVCILKSTVAGIKLFVLTNAKVGLSKSIEFKSPFGKQFAEINSGTLNQGTTPEGSKVKFSLGRPYDQNFLSTQPDGSGYKIILGK